MLTTRRAQATQLEQPWSQPPALIDALPDSTLVDIFMYLTPEQLVNASQVCVRWRGLSESRRLWIYRLWPRYEGNPRKELLGAVRLLRRIRGVAEFHEVRLTVASSSEGFGSSSCGWYEEPLVSFDVANDGRLALNLHVEVPKSWERRQTKPMTASLLLTLCIQELVKPSVDALSVDVGHADYNYYGKDKFLTDCEAFALLDCIANKTWIRRLELKLDRNSPLLSGPFAWPGPAGKLRSLWLHVVNESSGDSPPGPSKTLRSLLSTYKTEVEDLSILSESQQQLLVDCRADLASLGASLLPSVLETLRRQTGLRGLHLMVSEVSAQGSLRVLADALSLPSVQLQVSDLKATFFDDYYVDVPFPTADELAVLSDVARCRGLTRLTLLRLAALEDKDSGPAALRALLCGLPSLRRLELQVAPCALPLQAMLDADPSRPTDKLRELALTGSHDFKAEGSVGVARWPAALRRLVASCPALHVSMLEEEHHFDCYGGERDEIDSALLLPHAATALCEDCPAAGVRKGQRRWAVFFEEFLSRNEREERQLPRVLPRWL